MNQLNKIIERRHISMKYEGKFFLTGVLVGILIFSFWDFIFNHHNNFNEYIQSLKIEEFRQDSEERLLNYIEGGWTSSIGDVLIKVNIENKKDFLILELDNKIEKKYKIKSINKIDGLFGIIDLQICDDNKECNEENAIPIKFNKVFGMDKTITISYDSRLTYCVDADDICTRAFKRFNY